MTLDIVFSQKLRWMQAKYLMEDYGMSDVAATGVEHPVSAQY